jgi:hypothetical protein
MSAHIAGFERETELAREVNDERVDRAIHEIELGLAQDDPTFVRRVRRQARAERANAIIVVLLIVAAGVLLAAGLATYSWFALMAGGLSFAVASVLDDRHRRRVARDSSPN